MSFAFDATTGAIASLVDLRTGAVWADADHPLAQMLYQVCEQLHR
jgi:hypothetical protein